MSQRRHLPLEISAGETEISVPAGELQLEGTLTLPRGASGLVLFAHGSGSSRFSTRNRRVAAELVRAGLGTLLFDLLSRQEEFEDARTGHLRFDVALLASRLLAAAHWVRAQAPTSALRLGYFGASTGAAAALIAAAREPQLASAVVSRGGRPDLAGDALDAVRAPTLLIVGGDDGPVVPLNQRAFERLPGVKHLEIVPGASHLFEEPGALEAVARHAAHWFRRHLSDAASASR